MMWGDIFLNKQFLLLDAIQMSYFLADSAKEKRRKIIERVIGSLTKDTPVDTITRYLVNEYDYSLSGAKHILEEAKFRMEQPRGKKERLA